MGQPGHLQRQRILLWEVQRRDDGPRSGLGWAQGASWRLTAGQGRPTDSWCGSSPSTHDCFEPAPSERPQMRSASDHGLVSASKPTRIPSIPHPFDTFQTFALRLLDVRSCCGPHLAPALPVTASALVPSRPLHSGATSLPLPVRRFQFRRGPEPLDSTLAIVPAILFNLPSAYLAEFFPRILPFVDVFLL